MSHLLSKLFPKSELSRIEAAVEEAETKTSGEIVPYVVEQSDHYEEAEWRAAALLGFLALITFAAIHRLTTAWLPTDLAEVALITLVAAGVGTLLVRFVAPIKRMFAGKHMDHRVHQRAAAAFVAEEVFNTRDRTGILIFISLLEHRVLVLGDSGINAKVQPSEWDDIVSTVVTGIRTGKATDGLVEAIRKCGALLQKGGVGIRPDDTNELDDDLRVGDTQRP